MSATKTESIWANPLVRHLAAILAAKGLLLTLLGWLFFHMPDRGVYTFTDVHTVSTPPASEATSTKS